MGKEKLPHIAEAICEGVWCGDSEILPPDAPIEVLAVDGGGRVSMDLYLAHGIVSGVPARTACWIRHWPNRQGYAEYRSCALADIDVPDGNYPLGARNHGI